MAPIFEVVQELFESQRLPGIGSRSVVERLANTAALGRIHQLVQAAQIDFGRTQLQ